VGLLGGLILALGLIGIAAGRRRRFHVKSACSPAI
jgi:hypothetical protein